jgi:hypothetical protein
MGHLRLQAIISLPLHTVKTTANGGGELRAANYGNEMPAGSRRSQ